MGNHDKLGREKCAIKQCGVPKEFIRNLEFRIMLLFAMRGHILIAMLYVVEPAFFLDN